MINDSTRQALINGGITGLESVFSYNFPCTYCRKQATTFGLIVSDLVVFNQVADIKSAVYVGLREAVRGYQKMDIRGQIIPLCVDHQGQCSAHIVIGEGSPEQLVQQNTKVLQELALSHERKLEFKEEDI